MNVTVREATKDETDVDAMVQMSLEMHAYHEAVDPRCRKMADEAPGMEREKLLEMLGDRNCKVMVAANESGEIIGMAVGKIDHAPDHVPAISGHIRGVFVKPDCRRRGVARKLLAPLCDFFKSHGVDDVSLGYMVRNEAAGRFWTRLGFQPFLTMAKGKVTDLLGRLSG